MSDPRYQSYRSEMLEFIPNAPQRVLELGCARGYFADALKKRSPCEYWGVELSPELAEEARTRVDRLIVDDLSRPTASLPQSFFDVILCNDILEHLADPESLLKRARDWLVPGGVVVSSIPNLRYFRALDEIVFGKDLKYTEEGIFDRTHLRFFTSKSICRMFEQSGYEILRHEGVNASKSFRPRLWSALTLGLLADSKYLQFATVARPR